MNAKEEGIDYFMSILTPIDGFGKLAGKIACNVLFFF